ncbi:MAG: thymidine phosphorylase [Deltaproteobacteria bacterium]|nr:thymidine phosphorylase [Deltaproteobacteria bacterium]
MAAQKRVSPPSGPSKSPAKTNDKSVSKKESAGWSHTLPTVPELIARKRDGGALSPAEIQGLVSGFVRGDVADYQMSAFAMAVFFKGMTAEETTALTLSMRDSGRVVDTKSVRARKVDKHSTGGVGDKVSLCLAPLVAACGVAVPMVSGRGLGHTGGTLDKLEAIPGFSVSMGVDAFVQQVKDIGCALIGQTDDIAPADKKLYALRDVTATVESIPLITASILSKKLAEGIDGLVLDVKVGRGAFMKTEADARALAQSLVRVGMLAGKEVTAFLTSMEAPLGRTIGNALEAREAIEVLHGKGPADLRELTLVLGAEMLLMGRVAKNDRDARRKLEAAIQDRSGVRVLRQIVDAQGGDPRCVEDPSRIPRSSRIVQIAATKRGFVQKIDALSLGLLGVAMGAGRTRADQAVDPLVGLVLHKGVGDKVAIGEPLCELHLASGPAAKTHDEKAFAERALAAFTIGSASAQPAPLVIDVIRK